MAWFIFALATGFVAAMMTPVLVFHQPLHLSSGEALRLQVAEIVGAAALVVTVVALVRTVVYRRKPVKR